MPSAAGKAILLEPMIPDQVPARSAAPSALAEGQPLRLIYVGKYAPMWNTYEMTVAVAELRRAGIPLELHMVGDKIHRPREEPGWAESMERALMTPGVQWHKGQSREKALAMLASHHLALGWRDQALDDTLELSTKLLEYGAAGVPALINRTPMHEELLGTDYPLYANSAAEFKEAVDRGAGTGGAPAGGRALLPRWRGNYTFSAVARRVQVYIDRAVPARDLNATRRRAAARAGGLPRLQVLQPDPGAPGRHPRPRPSGRCLASDRQA